VEFQLVVVSHEEPAFLAGLRFANVFFDLTFYVTHITDPHLSEGSLQSLLAFAAKFFSILFGYLRSKRGAFHFPNLLLKTLTTFFSDLFGVHQNPNLLLFCHQNQKISRSFW